MLTINVKFIATELTPGLISGDYDIEDGSSVLDLYRLCEKASGVKISEKNLQSLYSLFNSRPVRLETPLTENGTLHVCRVVLGG